MTQEDYLVCIFTKDQFYSVKARLENTYILTMRNSKNLNYYFNYVHKEQARSQ